MASGDDLTSRSPQAVLEDHVRLRERGELDEDLERNYDADVLLLTGRRTFTGHDGVRAAAGLLGDAVDSESYRFRTLVVGDRMGFAEWTAQGEDAVIRDGVDSYLVEDGKIRAQTVHYTVISSRLSTSSLDLDGSHSPRARRAEAGPRRRP